MKSMPALPGVGKELSMKALVTGATGLVGRRLVRELEGAAVLGRDPTRARAPSSGT